MIRFEETFDRLVQTLCITLARYSADLIKSKGAVVYRKPISKTSDKRRFLKPSWKKNVRKQTVNLARAGGESATQAKVGRNKNPQEFAREARSAAAAART